MKRIENPLQAPFRALPYSHPDITKLHLEKTYAEKSIKSGLSKETAQDSGAYIQIAIEGAITLSFT